MAVLGEPLSGFLCVYNVHVCVSGAAPPVCCVCLWGEQSQPLWAPACACIQACFCPAALILPQR